MKGQILTREELKRLKYMWLYSMPVVMIAQSLGITHGCVSKAAKRLGLPPRARTHATGRKCRKDFSIYGLGC